MKRQGCRRKKTRQKTSSQEQTNQPVNGDTLRSAVMWIVDGLSFDNLKLHGNTKWVPWHLIILVVLWVWSDQTTLTGAFAHAHKLSMAMLGTAAVSSYQGMMGALVTASGALLPVLWARMHDLMELCGGEHFRIDGWLPLAVDGSRVSTPRTAPNEAAFCAKNYGRSASARHRAKKRRKKGVPKRKKKSQPVKPQIWLTLVWHMGLRLLWCWRTGPSNSSERAHLQEMLKIHKFPQKTLFCADAGFVGYDFWKAIEDQGHHFLMRVGSNVTLLRKLGYCRESNDIVYCWPTKVARKRKQPPLVLRLIALQLGRTPIYLVTNVLDPKELTVEAARQFYQLRWGIELQFRTLKQTFGRRKLKSKTPEHALCELDWSLMGLWMIQLFAVKEQVAIGEPPTHSSAALAIRAIRDVFHSWSEIPTEGMSLKSKLSHAVTDQYERSKESKKARYRPDDKDKPCAGKPILITANRKHKLMLKQYLALIT